MKGGASCNFLVCLDSRLRCICTYLTLTYPLQVLQTRTTIHTMLCGGGGVTSLLKRQRVLLRSRLRILKLPATTCYKVAVSSVKSQDPLHKPRKAQRRESQEGGW